MSMASTITGPRRVQVWQADAEWPDDVYVVPAEDHDVLQADRDIKAANLKTLVGMVLDHDDAVNRAVEGGGDGGDVYEAEELHRALLALARGLKQ